MKEFGPYLKRLREAKGLSLREVEKATEVSNAYVSQLESEKIKQPSPIVLHKLARLYEVPYETLMEKVGYPVTAPSDVTAPGPATSHRLGNLSEDEETALLEYLAFIRKQRKPK